MQKITKRTASLLLSLKYNYTPISNYEIQNKINPVIAISLGNQKNHFDLHFRVRICLASFLKMLSLRPPRTLRDCCLALHNLMGEFCLFWAIKFIMLCPGLMLKLGILKVEVARSLAIISGISLLSCLMTGLDFSAVSVMKTHATVDFWSPMPLVPSWTWKMWCSERWQPKPSKTCGTWRSWVAKLKTSRS